MIPFLSCGNRIRKHVVPASKASCDSVPQPLLGDVPYRLLADVVVVLHFGFVVFVLFGGVLVWRWRWLAWIHVPAVLWGVGIEWTGGICPLTPLENWLRAHADELPHQADFVAQYLLPLLYPAGLTRTAQIGLGGLALALNVAAYGRFWKRHRVRSL